MSTIVNNSGYLLVTDGSKKIAIQKPYTAIADTAKDIILRDSFNNSITIILANLTGWVFADVYDLQAQLLAIDSQPVSATATITPQTASSATVVRVAVSGTNATLLASNAARIDALLYNDSNVDVVIKYGITAGITDFTDKIYAGGNHKILKGYTGRIDAITTSGSGNVQVTEM